MSYQYHYGRVRGWVDETGATLDEAITRMKVPPDAAAWIRAEFSASVEVIEAPVVICELQPLKYCVAPEEPNPTQHYLAGFEEHIIDNRKWSRATVNDGETSLRSVSRLLVQLLPDPQANDSFIAKGLVLGYVQSGKTANMAALICRAADQGYRSVVVLAGLYNDLRSQTQNRLDQDIVGRSDREEGPFVAHSEKLPRWGRLTVSGLDGDFQTGTIDDISISSPKLAVLKKHPKVLARFIHWIEQHPELKRQPVLIIDDEADQATINSNYGRIDDDGEEVDPTATNQAIRSLVGTFSRCAYIGFTATPFANVLIDVNDEADLFPADFIVSLHEPPGYFGARQLFGLGMTPTKLSPEQAKEPELDVIQIIPNDSFQELGELQEGSNFSPDILRKALLSFILSCGARLKRGQDKHFSMLVHPSGKRLDHLSFASVLKKDIERLKTQIPNIGRFQKLKRELQDLWENDFLPTIELAQQKVYPFKKLFPQLEAVVRDIEVKLIHQGSDDILDYPEKGPMRRYVVVGGNRLSRGLTIEGLSVSFFIRNTSAYDTLLQMGRWFGYRNGYADLTRIFVDDQTADDFADLARIELELRADLDKYRNGDAKPRELVPLIRAHHRLLPTARNKRGAADNVTPHLRNVKQVVRFPFESKGAIESNIRTTREYLTELGNPSSKSPDWWIWRKRSSGDLTKLIKAYEFANVPVLNRAVLVKAISALQKGVEWDIIIPQQQQRSGGFEWMRGRSTVMLNRAPLTPSSIKVLREQDDISRWKDDPKRADAALFLYAVNAKFAPGRVRLKQTDHPLVGLAFVFPEEDLRDPSMLKLLPPPGYIGQPNRPQKPNGKSAKK